MNAPMQTANVVAPPPLIYGSAFLTSTVLQNILLRNILPSILLPQPAAGVAGLILIGLGSGVSFAAVRAFRQRQTSVRPDRPTTALVTTGLYRYTRNPIYWALSLVYLGIALLTNTWTALFLLPVVLLIINRGVIDREERYLQWLFGESYADYSRRVRRWL